MTVQIPFLLVLFLPLECFSAQVNCGHQTVEPSDSNRVPSVRIIGGNRAPEKSWPWQVLLQGEDRGLFTTMVYTCGATIISDRWILTAQHCASKIQRLLDTTFLYVGIHDINDRDTRSAFKVTEMVCHPYFDLALIRVDRPIIFSDSVQPICLVANDSKLAYPGKYAYVTGWGGYLESPSSTQVSNGISRYLLQTRVPIQTCAQGYIFRNTTKFQICAGARRNGIAEGDSGGPLQMKDQDNRWYQVGIVHGNLLLMHEDTYPDIYTEVASAASYINSCLQDSSDPDNCPTRCNRSSMHGLYLLLTVISLFVTCTN